MDIILGQGDIPDYIRIMFHYIKGYRSKLWNIYKNRLGMG